MASMWRNVGCLLRQTSVVRGFRTSAKKMDQHARADASFGETQRPSNFQKKTLVWAKMYKNVDDVPERVSTDKLKRAQRYYGTGLLLAFTAVGGFVYYLTSRNTEQIQEDVSAVREKIPVARSKDDDANKDGGKDGGKKDSDKQKK